MNQNLHQQKAEEPIQIEVYSKKDCCLCDEAKDMILDNTREYSVELSVTDIESSPELFEEYKEKIPVIFIEGEQSFVYKVHPVTLRKKLEKVLESRNIK